MYKVITGNGIPLNNAIFKSKTLARSAIRRMYSQDFFIGQCERLYVVNIGNKEICYRNKKEFDDDRSNGKYAAIIESVDQ